MYRKIQLKASLNRIVADEESSFYNWWGITGAAASLLAAAGIALWQNYNSCARALANLMKEEGITAKQLADLIDIFHQYMCNREAGSARDIQRGEARKFKRFFEKLIKLRQCKGAAAVLAIKALLGNRVTPEIENRLKDLIDDYNASASAAALAAALALINGLVDSAVCAQTACAKLVGLMGMLRIRFASLYDLQDDILSGIAAIALAIVAIKAAIAAAPTAAVAAALTALLATYQTALAQELENAGIPADQIESVTNDVLADAVNADCSGAAPSSEDTIEESPNEKPTEDSKPPASGSKSCCGRESSMD